MGFGRTDFCAKVVYYRPKSPSYTIDDTTVRTKVSDAVSDPEYCHLPAATLAAVDIEPGQQVRLRYDGAPAVFTVGEASEKFAYRGRH